MYRIITDEPNAVFTMKNVEPHITILLAVYRGHRYLDTLFQSYIHQTYSNWSVLARDDDSADNSGLLLKELARKYPDRLRLLEPFSPNLGIIGNFNHLLEAAEPGYVMFSDCDDRWLPQKLQRSMEVMQQLEAEHGKDMPLLVHSDLTVTDPDLNVVHSSFWRAQKLDPKHSMTLNRQLVYSYTTGCTLLLNAALVTLARPIPTAAPMHDWWATLVALSCGHVAYVSEPLVEYRQHGQNAVGSRGFSLSYIVSRLRKLDASGGPRDLLRRSQGQAQELLARYGERMSPQRRSLVQRWARLSDYGPISRRVQMLQYCLLPGDLIRNLGVLLIA